MNKIVVGEVEIEVLELNAFVYDSGRGEKVLRIRVEDEKAKFEDLKEILDNNENPIEYYEGDELKCEYVGYGKFESQYKGGVHNVELHLKSMGEQMSELLRANEVLNAANAAQKKVNEAVTAQNEAFALQNELLHTTLSEVLEIVIPGMMGEFAMFLENHEARLSELEEIIDAEAPVEGETVAEGTASE